jgi:hypothetical protein
MRRILPGIARPPDRTPLRLGILAVHFEFTARHLLAKLLDGHLASFVRSEGDVFIVSVNGQERTILRDAWRLLPEQPARAQDRIHHLHHYREHDH